MGYYDTVAMTLITAKAVAPKEDDVRSSPHYPPHCRGVTT